MEIMEFVLGPSGLGENIMGREASLGIGNMIEEEDSMFDSHRPEDWVSGVRPVYGSMKHHGAGN